MKRGEIASLLLMPGDVIIAGDGHKTKSWFSLLGGNPAGLA